MIDNFLTIPDAPNYEINSDLLAETNLLSNCSLFNSDQTRLLTILCATRKKLNSLSSGLLKSFADKPLPPLNLTSSSLFLLPTANTKSHRAASFATQKLNIFLSVKGTGTASGSA